MKPSIWLKIAASLQALGTVFHTLATWNPPSRGPAEVAVFEAMRGYRFEIMGATRSHWDFYHGYEFSITVIFAMIAVLIWQLSSLSSSEPDRARPLLITILIAQVFLSLISWTNFFAGPGVMSMLIIICMAVALVSLPRNADA
ncbi:MAG TPA: hypothetical protein VEU51_01520 [Candidatus Acidoferrales bacterium]|nr:hypothetical protein [Candidatus Acidoferrales bacterium]